MCLVILSLATLRFRVIWVWVLSVRVPYPPKRNYNVTQVLMQLSSMLATFITKTLLNNSKEWLIQFCVLWLWQLKIMWNLGFCIFWPWVLLPWIKPHLGPTFAGLKDGGTYSRMTIILGTILVVLLVYPVLIPGSLFSCSGLYLTLWNQKKRLPVFDRSSRFQFAVLPNSPAVFLIVLFFSLCLSVVFPLKFELCNPRSF